MDIDNNLVAYIYAKDKDALEKQNHLVHNFCKKLCIYPKRIYIDYGKSNFLKNKKSLNKLLLENENSNIIVFSQDRLARKTSELLEVMKICKEKNINIFDIKRNKFVFEEEYLKIIDECIENTL